MNMEMRWETDSMGRMQVPANAYYAAQTARAVENFPISNLRLPSGFLRALGLIKKHAARANLDLGVLDARRSEAIQAAASELAGGKLHEQFVVDVFQTGSGTSTNMNANEVIANRAIELSGGRLGDRSIHPNDHVNLGQSSNDVIPTAIHLAALEQITRNLFPALEELRSSLVSKAAEFDNVLKIGRTHLQDATPVRLGQEFSAYARQAEQGIARLHAAKVALCELALGGTAVGTGINTHPEFAARVIQGISRETGLDLQEAQNHFASQGAIDAIVEASGLLRAIAVSLVKIANDIRWLASGPRCGIGEISLPATQPGSSIMPGKVNPVMSEMLIQVSAQVIGNDATIAFAGTMGFFELNTMLPVTAYNLLQSIELLANGATVFSQRCVVGIVANRERCEELVERSLAMCTALAPVIGYDKAAAIAKKAHQTAAAVRDIARAESGLSSLELDALLDPWAQTKPRTPGLPLA